MLSFAKRYGGGKYSQNSEAGIIDECIERIGIRQGLAVEFGAPTKQYCSNIYHLNSRIMKLYLDINPQESGIIKAEITPDNVNQWVNTCAILSIDIDGNDLNVWKAYTGNPDIVIIEINSSLNPMINHWSQAFGASYKTMVQLGIEKGYFLLCHTGNCLFVLNKHRHLFPEIKGDGLENYKLYFNDSWQ